MADAKQCDRCKEYYTKYNTRYVIIDYKAGVNQHGDCISNKLDLCPCCEEELRRFVNMEDF